MLIIAITLCIRPIVALPLLLSFCIYPVMRHVNRPVLWVGLFLGLFFAVNTGPWGNQMISSLQDQDLTAFRESRIVDIALRLKELSKHPILQYLAFIGKAIIILFTPILRPLRIFDWPLSLLDNHIHYLNLDVEGHELSVFRGATEMLAKGAIDWIQFEFGGCNIDARTYFRDFFKLLSSQYYLYRLLRNWLAPIQ